jgi:hypothetical protein
MYPCFVKGEVSLLLAVVNIHEVLKLRPDDGLKNKPKQVTCKVLYEGILNNE